LHRICPMV